MSWPIGCAKSSNFECFFAIVCLYVGTTMGVILWRQLLALGTHSNRLFTCVLAEMVTGAVENGVGETEGLGGAMR